MIRQILFPFLVCEQGRRHSGPELSHCALFFPRSTSSPPSDQPADQEYQFPEPHLTDSPPINQISEQLLYQLAPSSRSSKIDLYMGSEGPPACVLHVTAFDKFHGVDENPSQVIAVALKEYLSKKGLPPGVRLGSVNVLETAGEGALANLLKLLDSALPKAPADPTNLSSDLSDLDLPTPSPNPTDLCIDRSGHDDERIIWVHMGVNSGANKFAIERRAVNEATFRCPDQMGWQPQRIPVIPDDGGLSHVRETTIAVSELVEALVEKDFTVALSDDAGRFVCNYVYYHSLCHAAAHGTKCVFVHVPPFTKIEGQRQVQFIASLLEYLPSMW